MVADSTTLARQALPPRATITAPPPLPDTGHHSSSQLRDGSFRTSPAMRSRPGASLLPWGILSRWAVERDTGYT